MTQRVPTKADLIKARMVWNKAIQAVRGAVSPSGMSVAEPAEKAAWDRYKAIEKAYEHNLLIEMGDE